MTLDKVKKLLAEQLNIDSEKITESSKVIDDLGAERTTDFVTEQLVLLLEERNYRNKPWIINSNLKLSQIQDSYNTRVSDRIMDRATAILLERPNSYRKEQAEQRMKEL